MICLVFVFIFSGCLYATQHFHTGVLLPTGKSQTTVGLGLQPLWKCSRADSSSLSNKIACNEDETGKETISKSQIFKGSIDYRLGLRDKLGPFPGVEMQWHFEVPTNPATMEFALNLALPAAQNWHHKFGAGWGVGAWADNSFFGEYALSRKVGKHLGYGNLRATWLATQIVDVLGEDFAKPFPSNQHMVFQSALGFFFRMPDWPVLPDFIIPQINVTLPTVPAGEQKFKSSNIPLYQWDACLGLGWGF